MRKKSLFGGAAVAAMTLSMMGAGPALAESSTVEAELAETATLADAPAERSDAPCAGISFPLTLAADGESYLVTLADDSSDEGSLRWALAQANAHAGLDEIVIGAGVQVRTTGELEITDALILRGADDTSEIINIGEEGESNSLAYADSRDDLPIYISDLTLSGSETEVDTAGLDFLSSVCALGLHRVTLQNFSSSALTAGDSSPFELLEIKESRVTGTRLSENQHDQSAVLISNEGIDGSIVIQDSTFSDNKMTAVFVKAALETWGYGPGRRASLLVENTSFVNNTSTEEDLAAGLSLDYIQYDEIEGEASEDPSMPMVTIRDVLFDGNAGGRQVVSTLPVQRRRRGFILQPRSCRLSAPLSGAMRPVRGCSMTA